MHQSVLRHPNKNKKNHVFRSLPLIAGLFPALAIAAAPDAKKEDAITVTATALPAGSYSAETASTGSKTATPIGELPQSVSVVTSQV